MKHKIEFEIGKYYYIDERQNNKKAIVQLLDFFPKTQVYCTVKNKKGSKWETMMDRLTEI